MNKVTSICLLCCFVYGCSASDDRAVADTFTLMMIPDTQNAVNFKNQTAQGFVIDSRNIFLGQMRYIANRARSNGGDVAFVASVGDVWEHATHYQDPDHESRGIVAVGQADTYLEDVIDPVGTINVEIPTAIEGYRLISQAGIPFGVSPGNHDYDAWFRAPQHSGDGTAIHIGGLTNFLSVFGNDTEFYQDKSWYVSAYEGGTSSAQVFSAGGYRFLHLALEMHPGDDVILWAAGVIDRYAGMPTIVSTHDFLNPGGERLPQEWGLDLTTVDPSQHNSPEELWRIFISKSDQIFMVLSGHQSGQAFRTDTNDFGHEVYQILADYQYRNHAAWDAGVSEDPNASVSGIGDGWLREITFSVQTDFPRAEVRTYSSHYSGYSSDLDRYAAWYRETEQPEMTEEQFLAADEFTIELRDFRERFGPPALN